MDPLQWVFVTTALTLIFVAFAINPMQAAIDEAIQANAKLQSERLASAINMMLTAPDGTVYIFEMPNIKCRADVSNSFVKFTVIPVTGNELTNTVSIITNGASVSSIEFDCSRSVQMRRIKNGAIDRLEIL